MTFEEEAVEYFTTEVPAGNYQRIDGVECFSPLSAHWFWRRKLDKLVKKGVLKKKVFGSMWKSCQNMPSYSYN